MSSRRKLSDRGLLLMSWIFSAISVAVLVVILAYIFRTGWSVLSPDFIKNNYLSDSFYALLKEATAGDFTAPAELPEGAAFSKKFGFALSDAKDKQNNDVTQLVYLDPQSPLNAGVMDSAGVDLAQKGEGIHPPEGLIIDRILYLDAQGEKGEVGSKKQMDAQNSIDLLDEEAASLLKYHGLTMGGGIRGSLLTTLILIVLTLVIAIPLGIAAAVWLNELAPKNKTTALLRTGVDMLSGVPSIIFGLMGMTMLFEITRLFGIKEQSIVLGALTMSVVLLPLVIRQTEEALKTVPVSMRMGSLSLGASRTQTIFHVVLPQALPGIVTAVLLSMSRIIGESAALIYTMGTAIVDHPQLHRGATTLALHIWKVMSGEQPDFQMAAGISIVILVMVLFMNLGTRLLLRRFRRN